MTGTATPATAALERAGIPFTRHLYEPPRGDDAGYGEAVAALLGISPDATFKTLVAEVDGRPAVAIVPVSRQLSLKSLAAAAGGKRAEMATPADAERLTGYQLGGISPFGQRRRLDAYVDRSVTTLEAVFVSGGRRGMQLELAPTDLLRVAAATVAELAR